MTKYVWFILIFVSISGVIIGMQQYKLIKQEATKQLAIENPAEKKAEVVERVITRTITKKGDSIEVIKEVVKTVVEKTPSIPHNKVAKRNYYVSGTYGWSPSEGIGSWGCSVGYNITRDLSAGLRYDTIGPEQRIAVEVRINF